MTAPSTAKRGWLRPPGCECDASLPLPDKCVDNWIRCNARLRHEQQRIIDLGKALEANTRKSAP